MVKEKSVPNTNLKYSFQNDCPSSQPSKAYRHISSKIHLNTLAISVLRISATWHQSGKYIRCTNQLICYIYRIMKYIHSVWVDYYVPSTFWGSMKNLKFLFFPTILALALGVNVNLMTHLEKKRVEYLMDYSKMTFAAAKTQATAILESLPPYQLLSPMPSSWTRLRQRFLQLLHWTGRLGVWTVPVLHSAKL